MKAWLKGGLWGLGIGILLSVVDIFLSGGYIIAFIGSPLNLILPRRFGIPFLSPILTGVITEFFIIGAIIGLIVGKIKQNKNKEVVAK